MRAREHASATDSSGQAIHGGCRAGASTSRAHPQMRSVLRPQVGAEAHEPAVPYQGRDGLDVEREVAVAVEVGCDGTDHRVGVFQLLRRLEWPAEVDALRRGEQLDRDD